MACWGEELEIGIHQNEEDELDEHLDQVAGGATERHYQTWEVDFTEDVGIGSEDVTTDGEGLVEVVPKQDASHIEEGLRGAIGANAGEATEHEHIHDGGEDRLDDIPEGTKDGLLVLGDDIALDVHDVEVTIAPEATDVDVEEAAAGGDDMLLHKLFEFQSFKFQGFNKEKSYARASHREETSST